MKVVASSAHLGHANATEVAWGIPEGHWEAPVRAEVIDAALRRSPEQFVFESPTEHGRTPLDAVHDPGLVDFLERAWREFQSIKRQREIFPDTFDHRAIREDMGPATMPASVLAQLGYWCFETMTPVLEGTYAAARSAVDVALIRRKVRRRRGGTDRHVHRELLAVAVVPGEVMKKLGLLLITILLASCQQNEIVPMQTKQTGLTLNDKDVLILLDGKQVLNDVLQKVDPNTIESIEVIKGADVKKYTTGGYQGVVKISLKKS